MRLALIPILAVVVAASAALGACGRKGPLERPPAATTASADGTAAPARRYNDRPFILDRLLR
mgnify:CR=1 FL=1